MKPRRWIVVLEVTDSPVQANDKREDYLDKSDMLNGVVSHDLPAGVHVRVRSAEMDVRRHPHLVPARNYLAQSLAAEQMMHEVAAWECADCGLPLEEKIAHLSRHKGVQRRICKDREGCKMRVRHIRRMTGGVR